MAQGQFYRKQVIPFCDGGFGEVNEDFKKNVLEFLHKKQQQAQQMDSPYHHLLIRAEKEVHLGLCYNNSLGQ
jgi:hypothetical protein